MKKNVVVLSTSGFVGGALATHWKNRTDINLIPLTSSQCNLLDAEASQVALQALPEPFTMVFLSVFGRTQHEEIEIFQRNVAMATHLIAALKEKLIEHLIFTSSVCVYGRPPRELPVTERTPVQPTGHYGLSKYVSEQLLQFGLTCPLSIFRIPGTFGSADKGNSIFSTFLQSIRRGQPIRIDDGGRQRRDFLFVDDLVAVIDYCLKHPFDGVMNVTSGDGCAIEDLALRIGAAIGVAPTIEHRQSGLATFDLVFDRTRLVEWNPNLRFTTVEEAARKMFTETTATVPSVSLAGRS